MQLAEQKQGPLAEYRGQLLPHIAKIMARMSLIYPPMVYPPTGPREDPREPFTLKEWVLGTSTSPGGRKLADPLQQGVYFVGDRWPSTMEAPQAIYWIPPSEDACRYAATGDTTGTSRGKGSEPDWDPTREYPEGNPQGYPFRRTGMLIQPWTVVCWGNDYQDTELLQEWLVSSAHDVERSQPEMYGESFTATRGGWKNNDRPGDRGCIWRLTVNIVTPIVRQEYNRTFTRTATLATSIPAQPALIPPEGPAEPD